MAISIGNICYPLYVTKYKAPPPLPKSSTRFSTILGVTAIFISISSWWFNYATSLPVLSAKVSLVEPLAPGQQIHFKVLVENTGKTTAKQMHPVLSFKFSRGDVPFEATYNPEDSAPSDWSPTVSDLGPSRQTTIYTTNPLNLQHDHDVNAVLTGDWKIFVYGKIRYRDILHVSHESHFCGFYRQIAGAEPLNLTYCTSYNETD